MTAAIAFPGELTVEVTADDITHGVVQDNCECPVARALKRLGAAGVFVDFGAAIVEVTVDGEARECNVWFPPEATAFIEAFDRGDQVGPITFTARVEEAS